MIYKRTKELLITAPDPNVEPVSVYDAAKHCNVTDHTDDDYLGELVIAARMMLEQVCWSAFITQTWQYWFNSFSTRMFIPRPPLQSIGFVKYTAVDGTLTTVDSAVYETSAELGFDYVRLAYQQSWPSHRGHGDSVTIEVTSGYGDSRTDVPYPIRQAIKLLVGHMYRIRGDEPPQQLPAAVSSLIAPYKIKQES